MKTPEQLAEEFSNSSKTGTSVAEFSYRLGLKEGFFAGYQTAKREQFPGCKPDKVIFDEPELVANASMKNSEWISVKERLPEEGQDCIFYVDFVDKWDKGSERINFQEIGVFNGKDRFYHRSHTDLDRVTHWIPLPEPPKGEE